MEKVVVIIGAGLSALSCAQRLAESNTVFPLKIVLVEGRDRVGGRLLSQHGVDLGAAWSWSNDRPLQILSKKVMGVNFEPQHTSGTALVQEGSGRVSVYGEGMSPSGDGSTRFENGAASVASRLAESLVAGGASIELNMRVLSIDQQAARGEGLPRVRVDAVSTAPGAEPRSFLADVVVVALPPRLAVQLDFRPALPVAKSEAMRRTPTWMENTGKVVFFYTSAFWRERQLSGTAFSQAGPMPQVWDNSAADGSVHALAGFVFDEDLREVAAAEGNPQTLQNSPLTQQLVAIFGPEAASPTQIMCKSWAHDSFTAEGAGKASDRGRDLDFGSKEVRSPHLRVIFAGTETAPGEHGHMNGAVVAGYRAAAEVLVLLGR
jgi:monoamine oxidase